MQLKKLFVIKNEFIRLGIKGLFTRQLDEINVLEATFETDEEDHEVLTAIEVKSQGKLSIA